jgi:hypothetical protein
MQAKDDEYSSSNYFGATWLQLLLFYYYSTTDGEKSTLYCIRGTSKLEGFHKHLRQIFARNALVESPSGSMPTCCVSPID